MHACPTYAWLASSSDPVLSLFLTLVIDAWGEGGGGGARCQLRHLHCAPRVTKYSRARTRDYLQALKHCCCERAQERLER